MLYQQILLTDSISLLSGQETGDIRVRQPSMMQSSHSSLLPLRTGSNFHWHSTEPIGLVLCQLRLLPHSTSFPQARRLATSAAFGDAILLFLSPPSNNWQQSPLVQHWTHRTHAVPTKIAPHSTSLPQLRNIYRFPLIPFLHFGPPSHAVPMSRVVQHEMVVQHEKWCLP